MTYQDRQTQPLNLPSGATCRIRKLTAQDWLSAGERDLPLLFARAGGATQLSTADPEAIALGIRLGHVALLRCCRRIVAEGQNLTLVEKPFTDCAAGELSLELLDQADAQAIIEAVFTFSGLSGGRPAPPFPGQPETASAPAPAGAFVSVPALGSAALDARGLVAGLPGGEAGERSGPERT
jgi:hypothetical protein